MNYRIILYVMGVLATLLGLGMLGPLGVSIYEGEADTWPLVYSSLISLGVGVPLTLFFKKPGELGIREAYAVVTLGWLMAAVLGGVPFLFHGTFHSFTEAVFEAMAGFTATGSTVLTNIEAQPRGILLWRSLMQWMGGMGIIVLSLAILPALGVGGMRLFDAEAPGFAVEKLRPRIRETARLMWVIYIVFSIAEVALLRLGGLSLYDSINHSFTTMATGGFSTMNAGIEAFNSAYVDTVITIFMFIGGANFTLHYAAIRGKPKNYVRNSEFLFYVIVLLSATFIITVQTRIDIYGSFTKAFRYAIFQVVSIGTTTGFATADYERWPILSQMVLFILMFMGGCVGSTGGGIKQVRILMFIKQSYYELYRLIHPRAVISIKISGNPVPWEVVHGAMVFFLVYIATFLLGSLLIAGMGHDFITSMSAVATTLGGVGPGFGLVGPTENFAHFSALGKWVLTVSMLLGRLEIYTVLMLFTRTYWRQ